MNTKYLSHRSEDSREETVLQHLTETAELASRFAGAFNAFGAFDAQKQAYLAGLLHDIGKYSEAFQERINGSSKKVDHSTAGAAECCKINQICAAFAIAGHHSGLPDGGGKGDSSDSATFFGRMNRAKKGLLNNYNAWLSEVKTPNAKLFATLEPPKGQLDGLQLMFFIRMLYSCLVDADFLCTEAFMQGKGRSETAIEIAELEKKFAAYTSRWFPAANDLNINRCKILKQCVQMGNTCKPGLFTLTVPTGGGKTMASLGFALSHARQNKLKRIIYVIPYTSIIEQNAEVFREVLGSEAVLEHHSNVLYETKSEADLIYNINDKQAQRNLRMLQATENWDMPVIVTTAVQFFESLYANRSSKCRRLHNMAEAVIIFDEAQMLPIPYLKPCVYAIAELVKNYGVSAILCTATQPALEKIFNDFLPDVKPVELCPQEVYNPDIFKRVTFKKAGKLELKALSGLLNEHKQVLCVVNSRKAAQEVYEQLFNDGRFHLSTFMYAAHRRRVFEEIRSRLKQGLPCRVVSTSLIEAGVDVDFPAVFREEAGLDSILQSAGRCNREGKSLASESMVYIFTSDYAAPRLLDMPIDAGRSVLEKFAKINDKAAVSAYFSELLTLKGPEALDKNKILTKIQNELLPFVSVAENFHLIDTVTKTVYIPLEEGAELTERLKLGERSRELFRKLGRYGVAVYEGQFKKLEESGALETLDSQYGPIILSDTSLYSEEKGLTCDVESGSALFI